MHHAPTKCTLTLREKTCLKRFAVRIRLGAGTGTEFDVVDDLALGSSREVESEPSVLAGDECCSDAVDGRSSKSGESL